MAADVDTTLPLWSTTRSSNKPAGSTTVGTNWDDNLREIQGVLRGWLATKGADIASAATTDLGAVEGLAHDITGAVTITSFGTISAGIWKIVKFEGALTLTHNATSLILPGAANITTADGDIGIFASEGSGNWRCVAFFKTASGALFLINGLTEDLSPDKTADYVPSYDASASLPKKVKLQELPLPRSYLDGFGMTNGTDATNDIDFAAGECRDSTNVANIRCSALTKQLDAAWAVGTNAGGRDTGAISNGTWHCYAIRKDSDGSGDFLYSLSVSAPTMPAGYTFFRRIGSIVRSAGSILAFVQDGDYFRWKASILDVNAASTVGTAAVSRTLTVPTGINVHAIFNVYFINGATPDRVYISDLASTDEAPSATVAPLSSVALPASGAAAAMLTVRTNTSAQIRTRQSVGDVNQTFYLATLGWIDRRDN